MLNGKNIKYYKNKNWTIRAIEVTFVGLGIEACLGVQAFYNDWFI